MQTLGLWSVDLGDCIAVVALLLSVYSAIEIYLKGKRSEYYATRLLLTEIEAKLHGWRDRLGVTRQNLELVHEAASLKTKIDLLLGRLDRLLSECTRQLSKMDKNQASLIKGSSTVLEECTAHARELKAQIVEGASELQVSHIENEVREFFRDRDANRLASSRGAIQ